MKYPKVNLSLNWFFFLDLGCQVESRPAPVHHPMHLPMHHPAHLLHKMYLRIVWSHLALPPEANFEVTKPQAAVVLFLQSVARSECTLPKRRFLQDAGRSKMQASACNATLLIVIFRHGAALTCHGRKQSLLLSRTTELLWK